MDTNDTQEAHSPVWRRPSLRLKLLVGIAIAVIVAQWVDTRMQIAGIQQEAAQRLSASETTANESRSLVRQNQDALAALQSKYNTLEARLAETQSQALALQAMYQEVSSSRDERLLAEVEQALAIAMQQLQFAGNVETALLALQNADARLMRVNQPQFLALRSMIARDIERLKATPGADITGLSLRIESIVAVIDRLPLAFEQRPLADAGKPEKIEKTADNGEPSEKPPLWRELLADLLRELKQLARIERIDQNDPALLSPNQSFFLRENIKLRLLNARLALLQRDGRTYREEIRQARESLQRYFDLRAKAVLSVQSTFNALESIDIDFELPRLTETMAALRNVKFVRQRGGNG